jgi:DNA modification methylase
MLGEQGFSNNADNYWDGFTPIVEYLEAQRKAAGWSIKDTKRIAGHSDNSGCHWFDKSQWTMPTQEVYDEWRDAAHGDAFRREYDDLRREYDAFRREYDAFRREWYSTRAHFDNTHDNMTDVWQFGRVTGEERHGHATPKPVDMICRAVKSSSQSADIIVEPFGGSGTTLIACEQTGRKCRTMEIAPEYVAVALQRWGDATGKTPELIP